uniref:Uncharacterized protein n=1 Tax=Arundo donax TaxID=35708 RepID=A0A0A9B3W2_ARUDO
MLEVSTCLHQYLNITGALDHHKINNQPQCKLSHITYQVQCTVN